MASESIFENVHILLLEDEALINLDTVELLQSFGCKVTAYQNLQHARDAVQQELPDVAVLDVNLHPNQTSYELAEWLHERHVPIIFLTGYPASTLLERWRDHPVCEKPCHPDQMKELLIKALLTKKDQVQ